MRRWSGSGPIPVVIVGFGRMGRLHAKAFARLPEYFVCGVVDTDPACKPIAADMGLVWYPDVCQIPGEACLAIVAVPSTRHAQAFREIAALGMDCLIEKPVGARLDELEAMAGAASTAGLRVFAGYCERFNPAMRGIHEALRATPRSIQIRRMSSAALGRTLDTDVLYDLVSHDVDWMIQAIGEEPTKAVIQTVRFHAGGLEEVVCAFHFQCGIEVQLIASRMAAGNERSVTISGEDGGDTVFHLNAVHPQTQEDPLTVQARALAGALRGERTAIARIEDALRVQRLLNRLKTTLPLATVPALVIADVD